MAEAQHYVTLLDAGVGDRLPGGGHVIRVPRTMNAGVALRAAKDAAAAASQQRRHLRVFCHGTHVVVAGETRSRWDMLLDLTLDDEVLEGGYGLLLGETALSHENVDKAFGIVRGAFESIVFLACAAGHRSRTAKTGAEGDGPAFCLRAARAANAPVYAPEELQRLWAVGGVVAMRDWQGPVYRFTPAGVTEVVKAT